MKKARVIVLAAAVLAFVLMVIAGPGTKYDWWDYRIGLGMLVFAAYLGMAAGAAALVLVALLAMPRWRPRPWVPLAALIFALLAITPPLILRHQAGQVPPIHDITTDPADPPAFVALQSERQKAPNGVAYGGPQIAAQQQKAYPDVKPLVVKAPPDETLQHAIDAARSLGWRIVATDAASGRIEATDATSWFGFKDDIIVRVRPDASGGSRVDVRSASRVGKSDLGANAARVRKYLSKLA
ncbi:MAG TPA: DUF1499 domain-containing protein [Usitatibacter sp.]|jgi:uncharacterized protein (DUF1499 family)|nr:DUF1499 domain-containing protein [Usitatibacter sp.]